MQRRLTDVLALAGVTPTDSDLTVAAAYVGGILQLDRLTANPVSPQHVALAWKAYLDRTKLQPALGEKVAGSLIALAAVREGVSGPSSHLNKVQAALRTLQLNWLGTWREMNLRWAGQLYAHALALSADRDYSRAGAAYREALDGWEVAEALDQRGSDAQRRIWRGMRAGTRLWLARQSDDPLPLLVGAHEDFCVAHLSGDETPQHFVLHIEVLVRLHSMSLDGSWLALAEGLLDRAEALELHTPELLASAGDVALHRGIVAMHGMVDPDGPALDDLEGSPAQAGRGTRYSSGDSTHIELRSEELEAAARAFLESRGLYTSALVGATPGNVAIWRIHRGQSLARLAGVMRLAGESILGLDRRTILAEAVEDLVLCESPSAPIRGANWPIIVEDFTRSELRSDDCCDLEAMADLVRRATHYAELHCVDRPLVATRLHRLSLELRLRVATRANDPEPLWELVPKACEDDDFPITPLIYAARVCAPLVTVDGVVINGDNWRVVECVIQQLEASATSDRQAGHRAFAASHGVTLLNLATGSAPRDLETLQRIYNLATLARRVADAAPVLIRLQFARAAQRYSRLLSSSSIPAHRVEALSLISEAISEYEDLLEGEPSPLQEWLSQSDPPTLDAALVVMGDDEGLDPPAPTPGPRGGGANSPTSQVAHTHSLLGEAHLRRDALSPAILDLRSAISHLGESIQRGNGSHQVVGLLADAEYRLGRRTRARAALRSAISLKHRARELGSGPVREAFSVAASAAITLWDLDGATNDFVHAAALASWAASADPGWPWPLVQLAELAGRTNAPISALPTQPPTEEVTGLPGHGSSWELARRGAVNKLLALACTNALANDEFRRAVLGGRSKTFVLDDPHRLLSATLVLKPGTLEDAQSEAARLREFANYVSAEKLQGWVAAVEPLAIATVGQEVVLATRRAAGETLSGVILRALITDDPGLLRGAHDGIGKALKLLAHIHAWRGRAPQISAARALRATQSSLKQDLARLGVRQAGALAAEWLAAIPRDLPFVGKRDAHTENWLIGDRGHIVALDLESVGWLPVGFEVAQLLEDTPLLDHLPGGREARTELADSYIRELRLAYPALASIPDAYSTTWKNAYACFAARRAVFLLSRGANRFPHDSSSAVHAASRMWTDHAIELLARCAQDVDELSRLKNAVDSALAMGRGDF